MSIKTRRFLFYFFVILFLCLGTFVILYSRGVRLDFEDGGLVRTGGIYISSEPTQALISLNGEAKKNESNILQRGTLLSGLFPDIYRITVSQDGYLEWSKGVEVISGEVVVFDNVILLAEPLPQVIKSGKFTNFDIQGNHMALEAGGGVSLNGSQVLGHKIESLNESGSLLTRSIQTGNHYLTNAFDPKKGLNLNLIFNNLKESRLGLPGFINPEEIVPLPGNDKRFFVATKRALYLLDTGRLSLELITSSYEHFDVQNDGTLVWTDGPSLSTYSSLFGNQSEVYSLESGRLQAKEIARLSGDWFILNEEEKLIYAEEGREAIATHVNNFLVSPSGDRIAIKDSNGDLFVYDPATKKEFNGLGNGVSQIVWHLDSAHLFVLENGRLYFRDISKGAPVSNFKLAEDVMKFIYDESENKIFVSKPSGIWGIEL